MDIIGEMRKGACEIANAHNLEVLEEAKKRLVRTRLMRIRRHLALPKTPLEEQYKEHLSLYVHFKLLIRKITFIRCDALHLDYYTARRNAECSSYNVFRLEQLRDEHRQVMSRIEHEIVTNDSAFDELAYLEIKSIRCFP